MWLIKQRYGIGYEQFIIDVEGKELHKLVYDLGGQNIDCSDGDKGRINPLHIRFNVPDSEKEDEKSWSLLEALQKRERHRSFVQASGSRIRPSGADGCCPDHRCGYRRQ